MFPCICLFHVFTLPPLFPTSQCTYYSLNVQDLVFKLCIYFTNSVRSCWKGHTIQPRPKLREWHGAVFEKVSAFSQVNVFLWAKLNLYVQESWFDHYSWQSGVYTYCQHTNWCSRNCANQDFCHRTFGHSCTVEFKWFPLKINIEMNTFRSQCVNFSRDEGYLKVPNDFAPSVSWKMAEQLFSDQFQSFSNICFWAAILAVEHLPSGSEWSISGPAQHTKSSPVELSHPRSIHISYFQYFHADGEKLGENKTSLPSWLCYVPLTVWCHCIVSPLNLPVLVLAGSM